LFSVILIFSIVALLGWYALEQVQLKQRELGRFSANSTVVVAEQGKKDDLFAVLANLLTKIDSSEKVKEKGTEDKKNDSVLLDGASEKGRYVVVRLLCYGIWPFVAIIAWTNFTTYYATVTTIFSAAFALVLPHLWLKKRVLYRQEEIRRELPLFVDLVNLATSAGWDMSAALDKIIEALGTEFPAHPLFRELRRARSLAASGYTWGEALAQVSARLNDATVNRVTVSLTQAMEQGGDRSQQLLGIAEDAQRTYYRTLDKRLAGVPLKALIITMVLFLTYFTILLAPAAVGISDTVSLL